MAYAFIVAFYAPLAEHLLALVHVEHLFGSVYPAASHTKRMGGVHEVAHHKRTVIHIRRALSVGMPYPTLTSNLHHEIELVVAIGKGGKNIAAAQAMEHIWGYAVGLDMTRRDLQNDMKKQGRPWCIGKAFEHSAPISAITPAAQAGDVEQAEIWLQVNGKDRQRSHVNQLIWNIAETIEVLSQAWELQPGDLIMTGTPEGVGAVQAGDVLEGGITGLGTLRVAITA